MRERDPELERKLGAELLAAAALQLRRSNELQNHMAAQMAEGARMSRVPATAAQ